MVVPYTPLTWRNVDAPSNAAANQLLAQGNQMLGNAVSGVADAIKQGVGTYSDYKTQEFLTQLHAAPDDATRKQMLANATQSFLNKETLNKGIADDQLRDFAVAGEGRAVISANEASAKHAQDLSIAKSREAAQALLDPGAVDAQRANIAQSNAAAQASNARSTLLGQESAANEKVLADRQVIQNQFAEINALPVEARAAKADEFIAANLIKGVLDDQKVLSGVTNRSLDTTNVIVTPDMLTQAGVIKPDGSADYSTAARNNLQRILATKLREGARFASNEDLDKTVTDIINRSPIGTEFRYASDREAAGPKAEESFRKGLLVTELSSNISKSTDPTERTRLYLEGSRRLREDVPLTEKQQAEWDNNRAAAITGYSVDLTGTPIFTVDPLTKSVSLKSPEDLSSDDVNKMKKAIRDKVAVDFPKASAEEQAAIRNQSIEQIPGLALTLATHDINVKTAAEATAAGTSAELERAKNELEAETLAKKSKAEFLAAIDFAGDAPEPVITQSIMDYHSKNPDSGLFGSDDGLPNKAKVQEAVGRTYTVIANQMGESNRGEVALAVRNLLNSGSVGTWGYNEIMVDTNNDGVPDQELVDVAEEDLLSLAMSKAAKSKDPAFKSVAQAQLRVSLESQRDALMARLAQANLRAGKVSGLQGPAVAWKQKLDRISEQLSTLPPLPQ